jgi:nickel-dependent lactate racemase
MAPDELEQVVPADILTRYPVVSRDAHDSTDLVHLGETCRGTPVWINRLLVKLWVRNLPVATLGGWFWKDVIIEPH